MNVIFWVVNFKTQNYFVISTTQNVYLRLSMYYCSNFVYSCRFKQFKLIVKMTRIETGVTIPKSLFTLYLNVKKMTAKILAAIGTYPLEVTAILRTLIDRTFFDRRQTQRQV
jgi:hypothetical protein